MPIQEIPNAPGYYQADDGTVFSVKILKPRDNGKGYMQVFINKKWQYVHRLLMKTFSGGIPDDKEVHHKDACRDNNTLDNLELVDRLENLRLRKFRYKQKAV